MRVFWQEALGKLTDSYKTSKGWAASCPFCLCESRPGNDKFLIAFDSNNFKWFHCFVCRESGSGIFGEKKIAKALGVKLDMSQVGLSESEWSPWKEKSSQSPAFSDVWPPPDLSLCSSSNAKKFLREKRGIQEVERLWEDYELLAASSVSPGENRPYESIVFPAVNKEGKVIGWEARSIKDGVSPKSRAMKGGGWKEISLFGHRELDPRKPVTIVEGCLDALSTPNAVSCFGKNITDEHFEIIKAKGVKTVIIALDPDAGSLVSSYIFRGSMLMPGVDLKPIVWPAQCIEENLDPNDLGIDVMTEIIVKTLKGGC